MQLDILELNAEVWERFELDWHDLDGMLFAIDNSIGIKWKTPDHEPLTAYTIIDTNIGRSPFLIRDFLVKKR